MPTPPRLVVLDGYTLTPNPADSDTQSGEPSWAALRDQVDLTVYDRTSADQIVERAAGASLVMTNKTPLKGETIRALPDLRYIGVLATGVNVVDLDAAGEAGVTVTNAPGYSSESVAQHVFALLLELTNRTAEHGAAVREGRWVTSDDFSFTTGPLVELSGGTLGIVGLGDIGRRVARIGHAMGMRIAAAKQRSMDRVRLEGIDVEWLEHDDLFRRADVVSLHCPLTDATRHLVDARRLGLMKPSSYLINTGRGPLIDEAALAAALHENHLAGAGLDVLSSEPPPADNPLLDAPRCIITPHIAWASIAARRRLMGIVTDNVASFLRGETSNVVAA